MLPHILALAAILQPPAEPTLSELEGQWRNPSGSVIIAIAPCDRLLCGSVLWASEKASFDARKGGTDPLIGTMLLSDIEPREVGRWSARLFVPDLNKSSKAEASYPGG